MKTAGGAFMRNLRTLDDLEEDYFRNHPEEIDDYLSEIFELYAEDGNTPAILSSLRVIAKVKGISTLAKETGMTRQGVQKALSGNGNPRMENIIAILRALGYKLIPERV
jgi:probable addiction module antidote protein